MSNEAISPTARRIVRIMAGRPPASVTELVESMGVTRTAITEQLNELVAAGYVERSTQRLSCRGRPRHLYRVTNKALKALFCSRHGVLVPAMQKAITDVGGKELLDRVSQRVSFYLARQIDSRIECDTPRARLEEFHRVLEDEGVIADLVTYPDRLVLKKRTCPFISMHDDSDFMCFVDCNMISEVIGARVTQTESRHNGDACCAFELRLGPDAPERTDTEPTEKNGDVA